MLRVLVACLFISSALAVHSRNARDSASLSPDFISEFESWALQHGKTYKTSATKNAALSAFIQNTGLIARLNANPEDTATYGHTQFSDMTPEQFKKVYFPLTMDAKVGKSGMTEVVVTSANLTDVPDSFDWRDHNAVSPVKDQGSCGCCWADSAVQNVESVVYIASKSNATSGPEPLSVEQVVECDGYDYACYGGYPAKAFQYILDQGGLASEASYPFNVDGHVVCLANQTFNMTCGDGMCDDPPLTNYCDLTCSMPSHPISARISTFQSLPTNETSLALFVSQHNPLSVALDAKWLQFYKGGVGNPKFCSDTTLDHAVLIVGFGIEASTPYWTVKNSWGASWGENGYFRIVRGVGKCGINTMVATAIA